MACVAQDDQLVSMIFSSKTKNIISKVYYEKTRLRPDMIKERKYFKTGRCLLYREVRLVYEMVKTGRKIECLISIAYSNLAFQSPLLIIRKPFSDFFLFGPKTTGDIILVSLRAFEGFYRKLWYNRKPIFEFNLCK